MRTIKFRGLRAGGKGMVYGFYYEANGKSFICNENHSDGADTYGNHEVLPEMVGQFTGLLDKQGKEIYEGDIVKTGTDKNMVITWSERFASFCINRDGWAFQHWFGEAMEGKDCEVIGNIHESPELIEGKTL